MDGRAHHGESSGVDLAPPLRAGPGIKSTRGRFGGKGESTFPVSANISYMPLVCPARGALGVRGSSEARERGERGQREDEYVNRMGE